MKAEDLLMRGTDYQWPSPPSDSTIVFLSGHMWLLYLLVFMFSWWLLSSFVLYRYNLTLLTVATFSLFQFLNVCFIFWWAFILSLISFYELILDIFISSLAAILQKANLSIILFVRVHVKIITFLNLKKTFHPNITAAPTKNLTTNVCIHTHISRSSREAERWRWWPRRWRVEMRSLHWTSSPSGPPVNAAFAIPTSSRTTPGCTRICFGFFMNVFFWEIQAKNGLLTFF